MFGLAELHILLFNLAELHILLFNLAEPLTTQSNLFSLAELPIVFSLAELHCNMYMCSMTRSHTRGTTALVNHS